MERKASTAQDGGDVPLSPAWKSNRANPGQEAPKSALIGPWDTTAPSNSQLSPQLSGTKNTLASVGSNSLSARLEKWSSGSVGINSALIDNGAKAAAGNAAAPSGTTTGRWRDDERDGKPFPGRPADRWNGGTAEEPTRWGGENKTTTDRWGGDSTSRGRGRPSEDRWGGAAKDREWLPGMGDPVELAKKPGADRWTDGAPSTGTDRWRAPGSTSQPGGGVGGANSETMAATGAGRGRGFTVGRGRGLRAPTPGAPGAVDRWEPSRTYSGAANSTTGAGRPYNKDELLGIYSHLRSVSPGQQLPLPPGNITMPDYTGVLPPEAGESEWGPSGTTGSRMERWAAGGSNSFGGSSAAGTPHGQRQAAEESPAPAAAQPAVPLISGAAFAADQWIYKDPQGVVQGPFTKVDILDWFDAGFFPPDLPIKSQVDPPEAPFIPLSTVLKMWAHIGTGHAPPGFVQGAAPAAAPQPSLQQPLPQQQPQQQQPQQQQPQQQVGGRPSLLEALLGKKLQDAPAAPSQSSSTSGFEPALPPVPAAGGAQGLVSPFDQVLQVPSLQLNGGVSGLTSMGSVGSSLGGAADAAGGVAGAPGAGGIPGAPATSLWGAPAGAGAQPMSLPGGILGAPPPLFPGMDGYGRVLTGVQPGAFGSSILGGPLGPGPMQQPYLPGSNVWGGFGAAPQPDGIRPGAVGAFGAPLTPAEQAAAQPQQAQAQQQPVANPWGGALGLNVGAPAKTLADIQREELAQRQQQAAQGAPAAAPAPAPASEPAAASPSAAAAAAAAKAAAFAGMPTPLQQLFAAAQRARPEAAQQQQQQPAAAPAPAAPQQPEPAAAAPAEPASGKKKKGAKAAEAQQQAAPEPESASAAPKQEAKVAPWAAQATKPPVGKTLKEIQEEEAAQRALEAQRAAQEQAAAAAAAAAASTAASAGPQNPWVTVAGPTAARAAAAAAAPAAPAPAAAPAPSAWGAAPAAAARPLNAVMKEEEARRQQAAAAPTERVGTGPGPRAATLGEILDRKLNVSSPTPAAASAWGGAATRAPVPSLRDVMFEESAADLEGGAVDEDLSDLLPPPPPPPPQRAASGNALAMTGPGGIAWGAAAAAAPPMPVGAKTLREIQDEEERKRRQQAAAAPPPPPAADAGDDDLFWDYGQQRAGAPAAPPPPAPPARTAAPAGLTAAAIAAKNAAAAAPAPKPVAAAPAKPSPWAAAAAPKGAAQQQAAARVNGAAAAAPVRPAAAPAVGSVRVIAPATTPAGASTRSSASGASPAAAASDEKVLMFGDMPLSADFREWCVREMQRFNGNSDLSLIEFLMALETRVEVADYCNMYMAGKPGVSTFVAEFLKRKDAEVARQTQAAKKKKGGAAAAAPAPPAVKPVAPPAPALPPQRSSGGGNDDWQQIPGGAAAPGKKAAQPAKGKGAGKPKAGAFSVLMS